MAKSRRAIIGYLLSLLLTGTSWGEPSGTQNSSNMTLKSASSQKKASQKKASQKKASQKKQSKQRVKQRVKQKQKRRAALKAEKRAKKRAKKRVKKQAKKRVKKHSKKRAKKRAKNLAKKQSRKKSNQRSKKRAKKRAKKKKRQYYTIVRGDTWSSVAKELKVSVKSLRWWNKRMRKQRRFKPGKRLAFYGRSRKTESVGRPNRGSLRNGLHLDPDGDGLGKGFAVSPHRPDLWGTPELIKLVKQCGRSYRRYFSRKYAPIPIGDLSSRYGGPLKRHKSHQSGRDVDVGYMRKKPLTRGKFMDTSPRQMNLYAQWVVLKCFLDDPQTQMIFIERSRVRALKKYIKRIYKNRKTKLNTYLAFFPGGKNRVIQSDSVHKSHMHVRIRCPKDDRSCAY